MKVLKVFESTDPELEGMHPSAIDPLLLAFEEDLAKQDATKKDREPPFPTPPAAAREHGDGTAPVGRQVPPAKG